jgi:hypothetical protein
MSCAAIRAILKSAIFDSATIAAITSKAYSFDILANIGSVSEDALLYHEQQINFFTYLVTRKSETGSIRGNNTAASRFSYEVQIAYHLKKDVGEADFNFNTLIDRLETLDDMILSVLGKTWSSNFDYYELTEFSAPTLKTLEEREFWSASYTYIGYKTV